MFHFGLSFTCYSDQSCISETDKLHYCIKFQSKINHGHAWKADFLIPIETLYKHFSKFWVLKVNNLRFYKRNHLN